MEGWIGHVISNQIWDVIGDVRLRELVEARCLKNKWYLHYPFQVICLVSFVAITAWWNRRIRSKSAGLSSRLKSSIEFRWKLAFFGTGVHVPLFPVHRRFGSSAWESVPWAQPLSHVLALPNSRSREGPQRRAFLLELVDGSSSETTTVQTSG